MDKKDKIGISLFIILIIGFFLSVISVRLITDYQQILIENINPSNFNALIYWIRFCSTSIFLIGLGFCLLILFLLTYAKEKDMEINKNAKL